MSENAVREELNAGGSLLKFLPSAVKGSSVKLIAKKLFNRVLAAWAVELAQLAQLVDYLRREGRRTGLKENLAVDYHFLSARFG
jgi:hypothetical protein